MRFTLTFLLFGLLLVGCKRSDAKLSRQLAGNWTHGAGSMSISPDGSFSSRWGSGDSLVSYQGTWLVKDHVLVMTVTNTSGTIQHDFVGSVQRMRFIQLDAGHLVVEQDGHTNHLERR
jgi:hypothetical protein